MELDVITIVLLGGVSVFGGTGRLTGVMLGAACWSPLIRNVLALNQIGGDAQGMVIGMLLIGSLLVGNLLALHRSSCCATSACQCARRPG